MLSLYQRTPRASSIKSKYKYSPCTNQHLKMVHLNINIVFSPFTNQYLEMVYSNINIFSLCHTTPGAGSPKHKYLFSPYTNQHLEMLYSNINMYILPMPYCIQHLVHLNINIFSLHQTTLGAGSPKKIHIYFLPIHQPKPRAGSPKHISSICQSIDPQSHMQDKKLVSIRPSAKTGRIDYMGGGLSTTDQETLQTV